MPLLVIILWSCLFLTRSLVVLSLQYVTEICPNTSVFSPNSTYETNLKALLSSLSSDEAQKNGFFRTVSGSGSNSVYGLSLCRGDRTTEDCKDCLSAAVNDLSVKCSSRKAAIVWYMECMVRYSNKSFVNGTMDESPGMYAWNGLYPLNHYTSNTTAYWQLMLDTVGDVAKLASVSEKKYATREANFKGNLTQFNTLHTLAQCTPDLSVNACSTCLQGAIRNMSISCRWVVGCWMLFPSCTVRYAVDPYYITNQEAPAYLLVPLSPAPVSVVNVFIPSSPAPRSLPKSPAPSNLVRGEIRTNNTRKKWAVVTSTIISAALLLGILIVVCKRKCAPALLESEDIETAESLKFDLNTIRSATNNFAEDRKLGEGGFGEVFKGKLESGQEIAVKRLLKSLKQGITEFKTEVLLVAKLQHRNLVKLLGFCLAGKEKLLIYELLPNSSLDQILFDPSRSASLDWKTRYKIIYGIARGLLYLHEESRLKIIHRDLKPSNVLLDKDMNPKISDFGTARLFGEDESHANTNRIAGTFGYMAPEYVLTGRFSVKSDVYSFGIMVLEILSGRRNNFFRGQQDYEESLIHSAWRLWNEGRATELIDSRLENRLSLEEATKCIHIALLCIQEEAGRRPSMVSVIVALNNGDLSTLPPPRPPHIFGLDECEGIQECGLNLNQVEIKFTGSEDITQLDAR